MLDTLSESLDAIVAEPPRVEPPPAAEPIVAPPRGLSSASLAPTQPSPMVEAPGPPSSAWPGPPSSRALALEELPSLKDALAQRVRVGQGAGPLWGFAVIAVALGLGTMALFSGSCSALLARGTAPAAAPSGARGAPSALASVAPPASTPSPAPEPPEPRALPPGPSLDKSALEALEARPPRQRSVDDVLAMGSARAAEKRRAVGDDAAKASQNPLYAGSPELTAKLKTAALDPDTMREALAAMAKLPSPAGADLLYSIWTTRKKSDPAALLAEALLATDDVRSRASPALRVVLDLRAAESCDSVKDALTRALEHGDRRVVPLLGRFSQKKGCGDDKQGDCWPCLREGEELKAAAKSVGTRAPPKL